jgi:hypothetical protein
VFQRAGKGLAAGISNEELRNWSEKNWSQNLAADLRSSPSPCN